MGLAEVSSSLQGEDDLIVDDEGSVGIDHLVDNDVHQTVEMTSMHWTFEAISEEDGSDFVIKNKFKNQCMDVHGGQVYTNGRDVQIHPCHNGPNQQWMWSNGQIKNQKSGKCLDIHGGNTCKDGTNVEIFDCHGKWNQKWTLQGNLVKNPHCNKCLDLNRATNSLILWQCHGNSNQQYEM